MLEPHFCFQTDDAITLSVHGGKIKIMDRYAYSSVAIRRITLVSQTPIQFSVLICKQK